MDILLKPSKKSGSGMTPQKEKELQVSSPGACYREKSVFYKQRAICLLDGLPEHARASISHSSRLIAFFFPFSRASSLEVLACELVQHLSPARFIPLFLFFLWWAIFGLDTC
jgi:hypothetical protein